MTSNLAATCNGKTSCDYVIDYTVIGDPVPNQMKDWRGTWQCGSNNTVLSVYASAEAGLGSKVTLTCAGPSPTPTPQPTPTPTPAPLAVSITSPGTNATFSVGSNISVSASATDTAGTVSRVDFYAGSQLIGTTTAAPYSMVWNNPAAGTYVLTANAKDNLGLTATSSPVTVKVSKALGSLRNSKKNAQTAAGTISGSGSTSLSLATDSQISAQLDALVQDIQQCYYDFVAEGAMFEATPQIDKYLYAAWFLARSSAALSKQQTPAAGVMDRLQKINSYLSFGEDLMVDGVISTSTLAAARHANAMSDLTMGQPDTWSANASGSMLSSGGTANIFSTSALTPLTSQTAVAPSGATYELAGVGVTINGQAAPVLSVSPTQVVFSVPTGLTGGLADIIVTSQDGKISHGTAQVSGLNPTLFTIGGDSTGAAAVLNGLTFQPGIFATTTTAFPGSDNRTRLAIWATGISSGVINTDPTNDIRLNDGRILQNLAESVLVEARTSDGRLYSLPVEFAGAQGVLSGLDQVVVLLTPNLQGAGQIQLTLIVGGQRSNFATIVVR